MVVFDDCTFVNYSGKGHEEKGTAKQRNQVKGSTSRIGNRVTSPKINISFRQDDASSENSEDNFATEFA